MHRKQWLVLWFSLEIRTRPRHRNHGRTRRSAPTRNSFTLGLLVEQTLILLRNLRLYAEIVLVTRLRETNVEIVRMPVTVGWTHRMNVVVFDKNPLRRGGPPCPPAQDGWPTLAFVAPMLFLNRTRNIRRRAPSLMSVGETVPSSRRVATGKF